jgi:hypothetical protein
MGTSDVEGPVFFSHIKAPFEKISMDIFGLKV